MKKSILVIVVIFLCITFQFADVDYSLDSKNLKEFENIATIQIGSKIDQATYSDDSNVLLQDGPQAFTVDKSGTIYLLDTLGKKILVVENGKWLKTIDISYTLYSNLIEIKNDNLIILDSDNVIYEINKEGIITDTFRLPEELESYEVRFMSALNDSIVLTIASGERYVIDGGNEFIAKPITQFSDDPSTGSMDVIKNNKKITSIEFYDGKGGAEFLKEDTKGNFYLDVIDEVADSSYVILEETIRKYNKNGTQVGVVRIPLDDYFIYPKKIVHIMDNGQMYVMALKVDCIEIQKVNLKQSYKSYMKDLKKKAADLSLNEKKSEISGYSAMDVVLLAEPGIPTRTQVETRAKAMCNLQWSYKYQNSINPPSLVTKPAYLANLSFSVQSTVYGLMGIPYCWGGFDGIDRSSSSLWSNFSDAMAKNKFAGNVNCPSTSGYKQGTAGVDCSGFASAAYGLTAKWGTTTFASKGTAVSTPLLMDYYVKSGSHIVLFVNNASSTVVNLVEATTDGVSKARSNQRTKTGLSNYQLRSLW